MMTMMDYMISPFNETLRRIAISGNIREEMAAQFIEQITAFECYDISRPITLYINSFGGCCDSALSMYDVIKSCACPIVTVGCGKVMSAAVLLLAAGDRGARFITQNTRVMIHEVSGGTFGTISEMENSIIETRRVQDMYTEIMAKEIGVSKDKLTRDMARDFYMSAEEAIGYGIADKLVPTRKILKKAFIKPVTKSKPTKK